MKLGGWFGVPPIPPMQSDEQFEARRKEFDARRRELRNAMDLGLITFPKYAADLRDALLEMQAQERSASMLVKAVNASGSIALAEQRRQMFAASRRKVRR